MNWNIPIQVLSTESSSEGKDTWLPFEKTAIHSGKLGDIIYALPTCRALGVNHLVLNVFQSPGQPRRRMPYSQLKQLEPLLLKQPYLYKVSITECDIPLEYAWNSLKGIDMNLDAYRNVARHRVGYHLDYAPPSVIEQSIDHHPVHLVQMFGASQGVRPNVETPWIDAPASPRTEGKIVVSLTRRWRTYPDWYWDRLLSGLDNLVFIGVPSDYARVPKNAEFITTNDHLELASYIRGAKLFLGTISFPYSLAEAMKVPRAIETCQSNLNAFPLSEDGLVLPPNVNEARRQIATLLEEGELQKKFSKKLSWNPQTFVRETSLHSKVELSRLTQIEWPRWKRAIKQRFHR